MKKAEIEFAYSFDQHFLGKPMNTRHWLEKKIKDLNLPDGLNLIFGAFLGLKIGVILLDKVIYLNISIFIWRYLGSYFV